MESESNINTYKEEFWSTHLKQDFDLRFLWIDFHMENSISKFDPKRGIPPNVK